MMTGAGTAKRISSRFWEAKGTAFLPGHEFIVNYDIKYRMGRDEEIDDE